MPTTPEPFSPAPPPGPPAADCPGPCLGKAQSPIDLEPSVPATLPILALRYTARRARVEPTPLNFQVELSPPLLLEIAGEVCELQQFHFHVPGEHVIGPGSFAMELHFVHANPRDERVVVGVLLREGGFNPAIQEIWDHAWMAPAPATAEPSEEWTFDPSRLLPADRAYFRYEGSLTFLPYTEGVHWHVFAQPIELAPEQVAAFFARYGNSARPIQERHGREVLRGEEKI